MRGTPLKYLKMFELLCGDDALKNVILTTTFWDEVPEDVGRMREAQLISEFWDPMIRHGSQVARFQPSTYESAWGIIDRFGPATPRPALKVQTEMVDQSKKVEDTSAFQFLVRWWDRVFRGLKGLRGMWSKRKGYTQKPNEARSEMKDPKSSPSSSSSKTISSIDSGKHFSYVKK
jgi:hypothetical protein